MKMKDGKWYFTQKALNLLNGFKNYKLIINSYMFTEGNAKAANDFFLEQLHTGFDESFLEERNNELLALVDQNESLKMIKLSIFAKLESNPIEASKQFKNYHFGMEFNPELLLSTIPDKNQKSILPSQQDLIKSVVTSKPVTKNNKKQPINKIIRESCRNMFTLLTFISNACIILVNEDQLENLWKEYLLDYHLLTRLKPSIISFELDTEFFIILKGTSFDLLKTNLIKNLRKNSQFLLSLSKNKIRIKNYSDSWSQYLNSERFDSNINLKMQIQSGDQKFNKKIQNRDLNGFLLKALLSDFCESEIIDLFQSWENIMFIQRNELIWKLLEKSLSDESPIKKSLLFLKNNLVDLISTVCLASYSKPYIELTVEK